MAAMTLAAAMAMTACQNDDTYGSVDEFLAAQGADDDDDDDDDDDSTSTATYAVSVVYSGTSATVTVADDIADYITISQSGAHVSIAQSSDIAAQVTYTLSGTSTNGSFYMDGSYKIGLVLDNLTLTCADSAAINIQDGKHCDVTMVGTSTLTDGTASTSKACMIIEGNPTFSGGTLYIYGNTKHALACGEKTIITDGTLYCSSKGEGDAIHITEYLQVDGGTVEAYATEGDGIDIGFRGESKGTKDQYENNGFAIFNGGSIIANTSADSYKAIKTDSTVLIQGATVSAVTSGDAAYDTEDEDLSSCAAVKTKGGFTITSGSLEAISTGMGGKGINAYYDINISGGTVSVTTTGDTFTYGESDTKPHGIKTDTDININGGFVYVFASEDGGRALKAGDEGALTINSGTVLAVGGKKSEPSGGTQGYSLYSGETITAGSTITYNGVSCEVPSIYSNSSAKVLVSASTIEN